VLVLLALAATLAGGWNIATGQTKAATATALTVSSVGGAVTTVPAGTVVTLTASVDAGATALIAGQVNFCDATSAYCTDIHLLGTAQLTSAGTAVLKLSPGIGRRSYKAVFLGTGAYAASSSSSLALSVTGTTAVLASTTTIAETGSWGNYALTGTVTEAGGTLPPSGTVSFLDASNGSAVLETAPLGASISGLGWPNPQSLNSGGNSSSVLVGDFNGDGIPDLAIYNNPVVVYLGNADGSYTEAPVPPAPGPESGPMVIADFNGDGIQDLAVAIYASSDILILLGKGDGTFTGSTASLPGSLAELAQLATSDFNGDGIPDLAAVDSYSSSLIILLGNGDGTFSAAATNPTLSGSPTSMAIGDFNGDGKPDLAVADGGDSVSILLGNGDGTFLTAGNTVHTGASNSPIAAADFNGDGKLDLAAVAGGPGGSSESVIMLAGNGDGTFNSSSSSQSPASSGVTSIQVADFNQDGAADVVITDQNYNASVLLNDGGGTFSKSYLVAAGSSDYNLAAGVGDLNRDGYPDIAASGYNQGGVSLFLTEPTETATAAVNVSLAGVGQHLVAASYSGNSNYNSSTSGTLPLWGVQPTTATSLNLTSGGASVTSVVPGTVVTLTATVTAGGSAVTAGQVNFCDASASLCSDIHLLGTVALTGGTAAFKFVPGAGTPSYRAVFVENEYGLSSTSNTVALTVGPAPKPVYTSTISIADSGSPADYSLTATVQGSGGPAPPTGNVSFLDTSSGNSSLATASLGPSIAGVGWQMIETPALNNAPDAQATGDFNGDGIPDLALISSSNQYGDAPYTVAIFIGKGDGTFTAGPTTQATGVQLDPVMISGDFNGDGKTDLVILNSQYYSASTVISLLGNGDGTFGAAQTSLVYDPGPVGGDYVDGSLVVSDFNGDGKADLAVAGEGVIGGVTIVLGNGDGTFTATAANLEPDLVYNAIATGDFNGDGIPDLVGQSSESSDAMVFLGKGDGTFTTTTIPLGSSFFDGSIAVGDFNQDGVADLAFGNDSGVIFFLGKGDGTFRPTSQGPVSGGGLSLTLGDFNHDGKLDLASFADAQIEIFIGAGDGTFTEIATTPSLSLNSTGPPALVSADFNGDGVPDLSVLSSNPNSANILLTEQTQMASATVNGVAPIGPGIHNVEASYSGDGNYAATVSSTVALTAGLPVPTFSPAAGGYSSVQTITISESVPGATIYYDAYGSVTTNGFVPYTGPISVTEGGTETIQAYATETGYQTSDYVTAIFILNLPAAATPVFSLAPGSYPSAQTVSITESVPGAAIYYTTNGSQPSMSSTRYTGPITVASSETLVAVATASGYSMSPVASAQYLIGNSSASLSYTLAGNGSSGYSGDGGPATVASLNYPAGSAVDASGNIYIVDDYNQVVRKVAAGTGIISTVAGNGIHGYTGDGGPAIKAELAFPAAVALDSAGNLYIVDSGNSVIRMVAPGTGTITTFAGTGSAGYSGDNGPATSAQLSSPAGIAVDGTGNVYISDGSYRVRQVAAKTGIIATYAGNGNYGDSGDGGPAVNAELGYPAGLATDSSGNLYIADASQNVIREVSAATGVIVTVAGTKPANGFGGYGSGGYSGDGGPATAAQMNSPGAVAVDSAGNLFIADTINQVIRKVTAATGIITTLAGNGQPCYSYSGDGGPAADAALCYPAGVSVDAAGRVYVADSFEGRVRVEIPAALPPSVPAATPSFSLPAGTYATGQTVTITDATEGAAIYVTLDGSTPSTAGQIYNGPISVSGNVTIHAVAVAPGYLSTAPVSAAYTIVAPPATVISTVAGSGVLGFSGAGGPATSAQIGYTRGLALDGAGNVYFSDPGNNVVWMVSANTGTISIVAGNGTAAYAGDGGPASSASLNNPAGLTVDKAGDLFIADSGNNVIREVAAASGMIATFAGNGQSPPYPGPNGDGGPATAAELRGPLGIAVDQGGNVYIADSGDELIRVVNATSGIITSIAGTGTFGSSGDGGPALSATLAYPNTLAIDSTGNIYIASGNGGSIRIVTAATGVITTVAGNGNSGDSGDGGAATSAEINPQGIALDSSGNLYLSNYPGAIREVLASTGMIIRVAGNGYYGYSGDGGSATIAGLSGPSGIAIDAAGDLYLADSDSFRIRKVAPPVPTVTVGTATATVSLTPSALVITDQQTVSISASVTGAGGQSTPTGSVTLTGGTISAQQVLADGTAAFTIPAGSLAPGANVLSVAYSGDPTYGAATGSTTITVAPVVIAAQTPAPIAPGASATINVELQAGSTYSGTMNLTCAITSSPSGAQHLPTCSLNPASVAIKSGGSGTSVLSVETTAATTASLFEPKFRRLRWLGGSGAVLAGMVLFGLPSRRRRYWTSCIALLLMTVAGAALGCGGGGSSGSSPVPGTTAGTYTVTVTGTDASHTSIVVSTKVSVTVQ
jgi:sugar lactone lactonase YvrE